AGVVSGIELHDLRPGELRLRSAVSKIMTAAKRMNGDQRHDERKGVHAEMHKVLRLKEEALQEKPDGEAEKRGQETEYEIDSRSADEMQLRCPHRHVEHLHEQGEEDGRKGDLNNLCGLAEEGGEISCQRGGGGDIGIKHFAGVQDAGFDVHGISAIQ